MDKKITLYPAIDAIKTGVSAVSLSTNIRHLHEEKWYIQNVTRIVNAKTNEELLGQLGIFYNEVYVNLNLADVTSEATYQDGTNVFILDENQESEKDRLIKLLEVNKND